MGCNSRYIDRLGTSFICGGKSEFIGGEVVCPWCQLAEKDKTIKKLRDRLDEIMQYIPRVKNPERIHCPDNQVSQVNAGEANSGTIQEYQTLLVNLKGYFYDNLKEGEEIDSQKIHEMILDFESTL